MRIDLLGPLVVSANGRNATPTGAKVRITLAMLAVNAGHPVPAGVIVDEIWGERTPGKPLQSVQTYVLALRRMISGMRAAGRPAPVDIRTCFGGYILDLDPAAIDLFAFEEAARAGRDALERDDLRAAEPLLRSALGLWRGPALMDVPQGLELSARAHGLAETRLAVLDARIEVDLRLGRHRALLGELAELTARHPMHESFSLYFMTALARSGQRWRALEVFRDLRATLVEELGVEPAGPVQRLHRAILDGDPDLDMVSPDAPQPQRLGPPAWALTG